MHGFLYKCMGILQRAVTLTLILRYESKFHPVKPVTLTHSACPYKNYVHKCSQILHELDYSFFVFSYLVYNYLVFNKFAFISTQCVINILRCESKFRPVKPITWTHSACPCKNYLPKCSQIPHELDYKSCFFFYLVYNLVFNYLVCNFLLSVLIFFGQYIEQMYYIKYKNRI